MSCSEREISVVKQDDRDDVEIQISKISRKNFYISEGDYVMHERIKKKEEQKTCSRCISDSSIPGIRFDENGVCNFCKAHDRLEKAFPLNEIGQQKLNRLVDRIKSKGIKKKYDCIVGVSGGTDSTYALWMAKQLGLRPLAVHFDNGWDSEIAKNNLKNAVSKLGVNLKTVSCDWEEFKDLQISFLKASVPEVDLPTDIAIIATLYRVAAEEGLEYILEGRSFRNEGIAPLGWSYMDGKYLSSVHFQFGHTNLNNFSNLTFRGLLYYALFKKIKYIHLLSFLDYQKEEAKELLEKELNWKYYGGHHYENDYTRFVYSYYLWQKFNVDKRKIGYSAYIRSGQLTREGALEKIKEPYIEDKDLTRQVIEKLGISYEEFEKILASEPRSFLDYPTLYPVIKALKIPIKVACKLKLLPELFYEKYFTFSPSVGVSR